ncbi:MAG: EamA family transporter [Candidatus Nanosalina sp.]
MIDGWLFFSLLASVLFAATGLFDKFFVDTEIDDYIFGGTIYTIPLVLIMTAIGLVKSDIFYHSQSMMIGSIAGGLYFTILVLYLKGVSEEDVSRFIPSLSVNTVIIAIISALFLGEKLGVVVYLGILMTVVGAFLISLENPVSSLREFQSGKAVALALIIAGLQATRDILIEVASSNVEIWTVVLWMGIGGTALSTLTFLAFRREKIGQIKNHKEFIAVGGMRSLGYLSFMIAISLGSVTMASAVLKTNGMFVFFGATVLSLSGRMLDESKDRKIILQKFLASGMIVTGVTTIKLFAA